MVAKVVVDIYIEVDGHEQAEDACSLLNSSLEDRLGDFPHGEVIGVNVSRFTEASAEELEEHGLVE